MARRKEVIPLDESADLLKPGQDLNDSDFDTIGLSANSTNLLNDWLNKSKLLDESFVISLYRYDNDTTRQKTFCNKYVDEIPNEHDIGMVHGGGKYITILQVTLPDGKRKGTTSTFKIDKRYDELSKNQNPYLNPGIHPYQPIMQKPQNSISESLELVKSVMGMIMPLLMIQKGNGKEKTDNPGEIMKEMYSGVNDTMKEMLLSNATMLNDIQKSKFTADNPEIDMEESEEKGIMKILDVFLPMIENLLPKILGPAPQAQRTIGKIKKMPGFDRVIKDTKTIKGLIDFIETKHGVDVAKKVMSKFGLKVNK